MKSHHRLLVTYLVLILLAIAVLGIAAKSFQRQSTGQAMLFLTQPVMSISGEVKEIKGNVITLAVPKFMLVPTGATDKTNLKEAGKPVMMDFYVTVNGNTQIQSQTSSIPYLFRQGQAVQRSLKIDSLKVGQSVTVAASSDLRLLDGRSFTAAAITLPGFKNSVAGVVRDLSSSSFTLKTDGGKTYTVEVNENTEISSAQLPSNGASSGPVKFKLSDLKPNIYATVYSQSEIANTDHVVAARIDPTLIDYSKLQVAPPVTAAPKTPPPAQQQSTMQQSSASIPAANPAADTTKVIPTLTMPTIDPQKYVQQ